MTQSPTLSVICPTYNRAKFLGECINSILAELQVPAEMLVVDDGSTDQTRQLITHLQGTYPSGILRYYSQPARLGAPAARNRGVRESVGEYIMFMDSDDVAHVQGLEQLVSVLRNSSVDFAYGRVALTDADLRRIPGSRDVGTPFAADGSDILRLNWHTMGAIYRRMFLIEQVGFWNEELCGSQDWELQARVKLSGGVGKFVDCLVGDWRRHECGRIGVAGYRPDYVGSVLLASLSIERVAKERNLWSDKLRSALSRRLLNHMVEASAHGNREQTREIGAQALRMASGLFPDWLVIELFLRFSGRRLSKRLLKVLRR